MRHPLLLAVLLCCTVEAGAGPLRDKIAARQNVPPGVKLIRDVPYGPASEQRFDVYTPKGAANAPVIFMVHGGGWKRGDKAADSVVENKVAYWSARGFVVVSANYRMLPDTDPLRQAGDVTLALAAAQQQAAQWGGAPGKVILMGHSAGAHLVSLIASTPGQPRWLGTVALDSAAFDVEQLMQGRHMRLYNEPFGADPAYWRSVSPYAQVGPGARPLLAVCSSRRDDSCAQARRYADKARALGNRVDLLEQDLSHRQINEQLGAAGAAGVAGAYTQAVDAFIQGLLAGS